MPTNPQQSEVHESTADASTSPTSGRDTDATQHAKSEPQPLDGRPKIPLDPPDVRIIEDQTDDGGPLVVESDDPDLNPPRTPKDPFPTERTPQIDPPVR